MPAPHHFSDHYSMALSALHLNGALGILITYRDLPTVWTVPRKRSPVPIFLHEYILPFDWSADRGTIFHSVCPSMSWSPRNLSIRWYVDYSVAMVAFHPPMGFLQIEVVVDCPAEGALYQVGFHRSYSSFLNQW